MFRSRSVWAALCFQLALCAIAIVLFAIAGRHSQEFVEVVSAGGDLVPRQTALSSGKVFVAASGFGLYSSIGSAAIWLCLAVEYLRGRRGTKGP